MWSVIRRHPITEASLETVLKFLRSHDNKISKDELPGKQYKWAHTAPLKIGKAKHGKITVLAQEKETWKEVVPYEQIEKYCRNAILNPKSSVPLSRDAGYHILQKETVGISRRAFYAFLAKQEPLQLTRDRNQTMVKPGRPLEKRGYLELDLVEAKGKDIGTWLHHPVKDFYFITIIDRLTGWFEVGRALHKDADTISKKIRQLLKRMAKALKIEPSKFYIRSDSGSEFKAETQAVFKAEAQVCKIRKPNRKGEPRLSEDLVQADETGAGGLRGTGPTSGCDYKQSQIKGYGQDPPRSSGD